MCNAIEGKGSVIRRGSSPRARPPRLALCSCRVHDGTEQEELDRRILVYNITTHYSDVNDCPVDVTVQICGYNVLRVKTWPFPPSQDGRVSRVRYAVLFVAHIALKYS